MTDRPIIYLRSPGRRTLLIREDAAGSRFLVLSLRARRPWVRARVVSPPAALSVVTVEYFRRMTLAMAFARPAVLEFQRAIVRAAEAFAPLQRVIAAYEAEPLVRERA